MNPKKIFLLDASSYVFRAYHAVSFLTNSKSFPTNAIYGFVNMFNKLLKDFKPEYLVAVFDSGGSSFRTDIYEQYKANRGEAPEDISLQFPKIIEYLEASGIKTIKMDNYEADDLIGSIAEKFKDKNKISIISGDKDFVQLIDKNVNMIDTMKGKTTNIKEVQEKYDLNPDSMIDFFALVGDSIDNIPGVKGIGPKTAAPLIKEYGSIENLYKNLEKLEKERVKNLLIEYSEDAKLSKILVTIKKDLLINDNIEDFKISNPNIDSLNTLFKELEFDSFIKEKETEVSNTQSNYQTILKEEDFKNLLKILHKQEYLSLDLETTSVLAISAKIVGISFSFKPETGYYIPLGHTENIEQLDVDYVLKNLKPILENRNIRKIGQNLKYETIIFKNYDINLNGIFFDTMIAAHSIDSSLQSYSLDNLARRFLDYKMISYKDVTKVDKKSIPFADVSIDKATTYSCEDADITLKLYSFLIERLKKYNLLENYLDYEIPFIKVLADIEFAGVNIDVKRLAKLSKEFYKIVTDIQGRIYKLIGKEINLNSPMQLREVLFNQLGLKPNKKTKTGEFSTDSQTLQGIIDQHDVVELILSYRFYSKLQTTYIDALPGLIDEGTKRIHTSYNHVGTSTGRLSSSSPNLQNIPIKTSEGKRIRDSFSSANKNKLIMSADYSQIELRLLAHFSLDSLMVESFNANDDIHSITAGEIFNIEKDKVTEEQRRLAKTINFGILYGIGSKRLSQQINQDSKTAKSFIEKYFNKYNSVKSYFQKTIDNTRSKGYSETILNRRRYLPDINSNNFMLRAAGERAAINSPIQGSAADIIKMAMILINKDKDLSQHCSMIMQVHDELVFEVDQMKVKEVSKKIENYMISCITLDVPLVVDIGFGNTWAESH
ncbi:DNA polymerase I [Desulfobacterota bacterium]|nr:DNA polymerase I [Thermodesulfobacteriota bacterium]